MTIRPNTYVPFSAKEIQPTGWLLRQLRIQADGLSGHLHEFWPDVKDSAWIGGKADGWERVPYWLDGFIPLAYLLKDEKLISVAERYMNTIMDNQKESGWLCPCEPGKEGEYDLWAALLMAKVLSVYADCTGYERPRTVLEKMLKHLNAHLNGVTLKNWGSARWFEGVIPALWLYDRTHEEWLLDFCEKLAVYGTNWKRLLKSKLPNHLTTGWDFLTHVVNIAMMLKSEALMTRIEGGDPDAFAKEALDYLLSHHGMACHHFNGDETLSGTSPINGSELCSVVEAMFSYEQIFSVSGNLFWIDQLERTVFNALPATISPDMWTHQYIQQTNQIKCTYMDEAIRHIFRSSGREVNLFGTEPHFGCCTANFNQGWPKYVFSTFMRSKKGIASCSLAPSRVSTVIDGAKVECELVTEYPFREKLLYRVKTSKAVPFTFSVRVPSFAESAEIDGRPVKPGEFFEIDKTWEGEETLCLTLHFSSSVEDQPNGLCAIWRGPLLYALPIEGEWIPHEFSRYGIECKEPICDYEVLPKSSWNYGFDFDRSQPVDRSVRVCEQDFKDAFSTDRPPISLMVPMAKLSWNEEMNCCKPLPESREPLGDTEIRRMIPYGCTTLRITTSYFVKR